MKVWWNQYKNNIARTHRHKVAYTVDEYKQLGYNTLDSVTHDADKMFLYLIGCKHDTVVKIHRAISEHHTENKLKKNLKSMFIDIHCSQDKPDKHTPFRDYFYSNKALRDTQGLEEYAKARNFGENVPIKDITQEVDRITSSCRNFIKFTIDTIKRMKGR